MRIGYFGEQTAIRSAILRHDEQKMKFALRRALRYLIGFHRRPIGVHYINVFKEPITKTIS
jgi:hypothetical protein